MDGITNADRFVALLRLRLAERAQAKGTTSKKTDKASSAGEAKPHHSVAALAAQAGADDRHLRRTIIEQLLSDRLGSKLTNEPQFQQVVERVTAIIAADHVLGNMLSEVMREVKR